MAIKLRRSESFYIREGWFEKAINTIQDNKGTNIFQKNDGVKYLGIGSNMVKGLKYWLSAADIIEGRNNQLSDFGKALYEYDRYLDNNFSWFLIHYNLSSNKEDCPVFYEVFNADIASFDKNEINEILYDHFSLEEPNVSRKYVEQDLTTFIKSYVNEMIITNPEDNYACPLSSLKLMKKEKTQYRLMKPHYKNLSCFVVYYGLCKLYPDTDHFDIDESMELANSPRRIYNLDRYMYAQYLEDLDKTGLITVNKTAGLNTVYFNKRVDLPKLYDMEAGNE